MRIFQVITVSEYGGAQSIVANLIKAFSPDHEVFVLYGGEGEAWSSLGNNFTRIKLGSHRKSISPLDIMLFFKLLYYRFKYKPDIVHLHSSKMGVLGRLAFSKKKTILTMHGFDSVRMNHRKFLFVEKLLKSRAAKIVGVSKYDADSLKSEGIKDNVEYIYNGVPDLLSEQKIKYNDSFVDKIKRIKAEYPKIVMSVARISNQKRFDLFLEVASLLPQYAFIWIGNKEQIENTPQNVFCLGEIDSAQIYLKFADLFILCSNYEGLPMSLLEAMSFGKPAVVSAVGGMPEIMNQGNGFAVENNASAFADKIESILANETIYNQMSVKTREVFLKNHTMDKMVSKYLELYKTMIKA